MVSLSGTNSKDNCVKYRGVGNVISRIGKQGKYLLTVSTDGSGAYLVDG